MLLPLIPCSIAPSLFFLSNLLFVATRLVLALGAQKAGGCQCAHSRENNVLLPRALGEGVGCTKSRSVSESCGCLPFFSLSLSLPCILDLCWSCVRDFWIPPWRTEFFPSLSWLLAVISLSSLVTSSFSHTPCMLCSSGSTPLVCRCFREDGRFMFLVVQLIQYLALQVSTSQSCPS